MPLAILFLLHAASTHGVGSRWFPASLQAEYVFEFLVIAGIVFREADVADVKLDAFSLQIVRLDAAARRAAPEAAQDLLPFFGERKVDEQLADIRMRRGAPQCDGRDPADHRRDRQDSTGAPRFFA